MILSKTNMQRVNLAMLMVCVSTVIVGSRVSASPAVTVLPDDAAKIIIYNAGSDGSPVENCQIPIEKLAVDFKNNEYGWAASGSKCNSQLIVLSRLVASSCR